MDSNFKQYGTWDVLKTWIPSIIILPLGLYLLFNRGHYTWIDNADLVIHEGGHVFFSFFGKFIYTLGGTLMQIFIPSLFIWYFFSSYYKTGAQFSLLWLGQNFINISIYAADARAQNLPLLGGHRVYHDWHYLLGQLGILQYDYAVGVAFVVLAVLAFGVAVLMPLIIQE